MAASCGILGLPNSGKTTLFNAMTESTTGAADAYPFTTIAPNRGRVLVPDERLQQIATIMRPQTQIPAEFPVVDIAGLVKGASRGEGLGNQFLGHVREMAMLIHVVRCFAAPDVPHVEGSLEPLRDIGIMDTELCLADLETLARRRDHLAQEAKGKTRAARAIDRQGEQLDRLEGFLNAARPLRQQSLTLEERQLASELALVSAKPVLYVANLDEVALAHPEEDEHYRTISQLASQQGAGVVAVSAQLASELCALTGEERQLFMAELGLEAGPLGHLGQAVYRTLSLITFFTVNEKEVRARSLTRGENALAAAGAVHSDMARGFIRAEVISAPQLVAAGSMAAARERGWLRLEGRDYPVEDGDILYIRFAV